MYFGDVYVFSIQTITLLRDFYFVHIANEWCHNLILSTYVKYILYHERNMVIFLTYGLSTGRLLAFLLWYKRNTVRR